MFDPVRICELLNEEHAAYVVVGGFAAVVHGSSLPTSDIDVVPSRAPENLDRLARALRRMNARIRTSGEPVLAPLDGPFLANMPLMLNLVTDFGEVDLTFSPSGGLGGFDEWDEHAVVVDIAEGVTVHVAALDDIIGSKRAAGRLKDQRALPYLESLRDQARLGGADPAVSSADAGP
ncbi:MAG: hypothetical protein M3487_03225 [Actinomycetota bacterium]|nr:hypothetical protein [Acidimicrobiia bacterium]MDQ3468774.1 hypothetical protein [Actinomycetota bacterium]